MFISVENITKQFPLHRAVFKHSATGSMPAPGRQNIYALNNVSFELNAGDVLGVVGHNGSGKSTLLRIISGIIPPSSGKVKYHGSLASILDVGTGFHPDLTGADNVRLSCKIHGLSKSEIDLCFNSIVQFSEIGDYIDVPVKYYSSGMYLKLAFSVMLHINVDILLIDEVLNVGDASFRIKCTQKVEELIARGKIAIISSHDLGSVSRLCNKCLVLENGEVTHLGDTQSVLQNYMEYVVIKSIEEVRKNKQAAEEEITQEPDTVKAGDNLQASNGEQQELKNMKLPEGIMPDAGKKQEVIVAQEYREKQEVKPANVLQYQLNTDLYKDELVHVIALNVFSSNETDAEKLYVGDKLIVQLVFEKFTTHEEVDFFLVFKDYLYMPVFLLNTRMADQKLIPAAKGKFKIIFTLPAPFLNKGFFTADLLIIKREGNVILKEAVNALAFHVYYHEGFFQKYGGGENFPGPLMPKFDVSLDAM